jgi:hypothetical protein
MAWPARTLGHRRRKHDPLHRIRKLLAFAADRLDDRGEAKLCKLLALAADRLDDRGEAKLRGPLAKRDELIGAIVMRRLSGSLGIPRHWVVASSAGWR